MVVLVVSSSVYTLVYTTVRVVCGYVCGYGRRRPRFRVTASRTSAIPAGEEKRR